MVTLRVAPWSVVALRDGLLVFMQLVLFRLRFVFKSCTLRNAVVVQMLECSGVAQPLRDALCAVVSDHSLCVAAP